MEKLELKHLAAYLPYGLTVTKEDWGKIVKVDADGTTLNHAGINYVLRVQAKPVLRPLSDLTNEIEHNGERFVPIMEMAKMYSSTNNVKKIEGVASNFHYFKCFYTKKDYQVLIINTDCRAWFTYYFDDDKPNYGINIVNEWEVREKLLSWHFDIFGLMEKGLAVDLNTLNETK